jgi:hypothetical protein
MICTEPGSNRKRDRALGIAGFALLLGLAALAFFRDRLSAFPLFCVVRATTGYYCPGCGATRALGALLRLDIPTAFSMNVFLTPLLPVLGYIVSAELLRMIAGRYLLPQLPLHPWVVAALGILFVAFGILRNVPALSFLEPGRIHF